MKSSYPDAVPAAVRATSDDTQRPARLNPFAFPSDTTSRFFLLIVFVVAADVVYWNGIADQLGGIKTLDRCLNGRPFFGVSWVEEGTAGYLMRCVQDMAAHQAPWLALGLGLLIPGTLGVFWSHPIWLRWRLRLEILPGSEVPDLVEALNALCAVAGLRELPAFLWNPLDGSPRALAFGRSGRRSCVALTGGIAGLFYRRPEAFRALMLHELAHIRNGDIVKTYLTVAVWWTFVATALVPYLLVELGPEHEWWNVLDALFRLSVFGVIVLLSRNAVLRARELYADVRASTWEDGDRGLGAALATLRSEQRLPRWLSVHPDPSLRRRLLKNTDALFRAHTWNALGIGAAAAITVPGLMTLLAAAGYAFAPAKNAGMNVSAAMTMLFVPFVVVVPLTTVAAVVIVWRGALLATVRGYRPHLMRRTALPLATGAVFGIPVFLGYPFLVAFSGGSGARYMALKPVPIGELLLGGIAVMILAVLGLSITFALYLSWVHSGARAWLPVALRQRTPRPVWTAGLVVAAVLALPWFSGVPLMVAAILDYAVEAAGRKPASLAELAAYILSTTRLFPFSLLAWVSLVAVWAYPMAAAIRWPREGASSWVWLDPGPPVSLALPLRVGRSLLVGIGGGVFGATALWFTVLDLPPGVVQQLHLPQTPFAVQLASVMVVAIVAQVPISIAATLAAPSLAFVHAMFAAFAGSLVLVVAECLRVLIWVPDANLRILLSAIFAPTVIGGAFAALPGAAAMAALLDRGR